jgi:hypothetical protein
MVRLLRQLPLGADQLQPDHLKVTCDTVIARMLLQSLQAFAQPHASTPSTARCGVTFAESMYNSWPCERSPERANASRGPGHQPGYMRLRRDCLNVLVERNRVRETPLGALHPLLDDAQLGANIEAAIPGRGLDRGQALRQSPGR